MGDVDREQLVQRSNQLAAQLGRGTRLRRGDGDAVQRGLGASCASA
jgi:hypothetical protein